MGTRRTVEVEPLSDARWAHIEKQVFASVDREAKDPLLQPMSAPRPVARFGGKHGLGAALALAAAAALVLFLVRSLGAGGGVPVAANPSRIVTGPSESHLAVGESSIDVAPESTALVSGDDDHGLLVVIDRGAASFDVAPRRGRPPIVVQAGDVRVRVVGTRFTVTRDGDGARVEVEHGTVEVVAHGRTTLVHEGQRWPSSLAVGPAPFAPAPPTTDAPPAPEAPPRPLAATTPAPRLSTTALHPSPVVTAIQESLPRPPPPPLPADAVSAPPPPATAPGSPPEPSPRDLFETASELEGRDPARAAAIYEKLAGSGGAWGMNALFAWARLEADGGNRSEARRLLGDYLTRYPHGPNAADARALLERLR